MADVPKPERPAEMAQDGLAGAKAAATYFLSLYPYALSAVSKREIESMSDPDCIFCADVARKVDDRKKADTHEVGGNMTFRDVRGRVVSDASYFVTLTARQAPSRTLASSGEIVENYPRTTDNDVSIVVHRKAGKWIIRAVSIDDSREA